MTITCIGVRFKQSQKNTEIILTRRSSLCAIQDAIFSGVRNSSWALIQSGAVASRSNVVVSSGNDAPIERFRSIQANIVDHSFQQPENKCRKVTWSSVGLNKCCQIVVVNSQRPCLARRMRLLKCRMRRLGRIPDLQCVLFDLREMERPEDASMVYLEIFPAGQTLAEHNSILRISTSGEIGTQHSIEEPCYSEQHEQV